MTDPIERAAIALYDRFTHEGLDRRAFMAALTRVCGGAAAASAMLTSVACSAESAPLVPSDDHRIHADTGSVDLGAGPTYQVYRASPAGADWRTPAVMVIHENRGLNDYIRDVTRRLAIAGFAGGSQNPTLIGFVGTNDGFDIGLTVRSAFTALPVERLAEPPSEQLAEHIARRLDLTRYLVEVGLEASTRRAAVVH